MFKRRATTLSRFAALIYSIKILQHGDVHLVQWLYVHFNEIAYVTRGKARTPSIADLSIRHLTRICGDHERQWIIVYLLQGGPKSKPISEIIIIFALKPAIMARFFISFD